MAEVRKGTEGRAHQREGHDVCSSGGGTAVPTDPGEPPHDQHSPQKSVFLFWSSSPPRLPQGPPSTSVFTVLGFLLSPPPPTPLQRRFRPRRRRRLPLIRYPGFGCHVSTSTSYRQFVVDELGKNQPGSHRGRTHRHGDESTGVAAALPL